MKAKTLKCSECEVVFTAMSLPACREMFKGHWIQHHQKVPF